MKQYLHLRFSRIGTIPVVGYVFYGIQLALLRLHLSRVLYISAKDKRWFPLVAKIAEQQRDGIFCETVLIGHPLVFFTKPIILSVPASHKKVSIEIETIYDRLVWTLASVKGMDSATRAWLNSFLTVDISLCVPVISKRKFI